MIPQNITDDVARDLSAWVTEVHQNAKQAATAFLQANPSRRFVQVQPFVNLADGRTENLGEPILFSRKGLGL